MELDLEQPGISAGKETSETRQSLGGVGDSMWSSRRDDGIAGFPSERGPKSKPLEWGSSSPNQGRNRSESDRRWESSHWSPPPRSEKDDGSYRPEIRDRKYPSSSRRDDRDKGSRYARDSERPYRPKDNKYPKANTTNSIESNTERLGTITLNQPVIGAQGEGKPPKGACGETSTRADTRYSAAGGPMPRDEGNSSGMVMPHDETTTIATTSGLWPIPGGTNTSISGKWAPAATDSNFRRGAGKPNPESDVSKGHVTSGDYSARKNDKDWKPDWSERSRGRGQGRPSRGKPRDDRAPPKTRESGWSSYKNEDRNIDKGRKYSDSKGSAKDKWKSKEKPSYGGESGNSWQTGSPQAQSTAATNSHTQWTTGISVDPDGDWAGLNTATDSLPQWTAVSVDPDGDWAGLNTSTDSKPQWTAVSVDPDGDWAGLNTVTESQPQWTAVSVDPDGDWAGLNTVTDSQPQWTSGVSVDPDGDWATRETELPGFGEEQVQDGNTDEHEFVKWVPGIRGGGRGRHGRGRVRGPRVRKKKVPTIGLMRGFQDDPKEEDDGKLEEATQPVDDPEEPPNPFWYLAEGEAPEDELTKWAMPS